MRLHELFDKQDELLEMQEEIFFEVLQSGGEITEGQQIQLDHIEQELDSHSSLIMEYPDKIGYLETKIQSDIDYAAEWEKRFYNKKKALEKKKENLRAWVAKTIRNVIGNEEKIKGAMVTIKDITDPKHREIIEKKSIPLSYQDAVYKIPADILENDKYVDIIKQLEEFRHSNVVNESRIKKADICPDGVIERIRYNCQIWGLSKIKEKIGVE